MRYKYFDLTMLNAMLALAILSGYQFLYSNFKQNFREGVESIALIKNQDEVVKRKNFELFSWLDANRGDRLANNDLVYTYDRSAADIVFDDGFEISLSEKTLFRVTRQEEVKTIIVREGIMHTELTPKINRVKFELAGKKIDVNSQGAQLQILKGKEKSRITVLSGKATITADNETKELSKDQFYELDNQSQKTVVKTMEIKILEPRSNSLHYFAKSPSITFKWQAQASATLMISRDRDFKDVLYQKEASGEILVSDLPFAHLYWKVVSAEGESELRTLKLKRDLPPTLIAPYDKARLSFEEGSRRLLFKWENQNTQGYEIEIDLKKETIKEVVNKNHFILAEAAPGVYRWRVKAKDANRSDSAWSEYSYFEVESELKPLPTELLKPDDEARFEFFDQQTLASTEVTYSWQENKKAKSYQWILKKSGQIIETYESIDTALTRKLSQAGEFDWSVLSIDFYGKRSEESASRKLIVQLNENAFDKETGATQIQLKKPNQKVHFEWEGEKDREYLFELSETQDFSQIRIKKKSKSPKADFTFPKVGVYYWRTKKILPNGKIEYSRPKKVEVEPTPPPKKLELAPELELEVQRKKTTSIFSVFISSAYASNEFVKVSWPVEEEMKAYVIEIYQDQSMKKLILKRKTETNSIEWTNPPEGTFYYRVAQIDFWDRQSEFSNLSKISITVPDELKIQDPVKLTGPEDEEELLSKQKIYYFEWSTTENADSYMLEVAHDKEFTKVVYRKTVKDTKHAVREDIFRKHMRVFWRVSALGSYSQKVSSEIQILSLKIPEIAQAPKVEVVEVKKPQKPRPRIHPKFLRFYDYMEMGWQPSNITYTIDDKEFNGEITGLAKSSLYLKGRSIYKPRRFYDYYLRWQTGKTFEGQSQWLNSEFQFFMGRPQVWGNTKFVAKYGLQGNYFSAHKIETNELLVDENKFLFSGALQAEFEFGKRNPVGQHLTIGAAIGQVMEANLQYELRYYGFKNFTLHGGVGDYFKIMNLDSGTHQVHEQRINLGLSFYFPPKWEEFISGDFWSSMKVSKPHPQNNEVKRTGRKQE